MKKYLKSPLFVAVIVIILVLAIFAFISLPKTIEDVKTEENIGKSVRVRGEVKSVLKIGSLSGYTLEDKTGSIAISSDDLPNEGERISVRGVVIRDTLLGYYIKVN